LLLSTSQGNALPLESYTLYYEPEYRTRWTLLSRWGLTTSDDYGNPVGEFRSANKIHKKKNRRRR